MIEMVGVAVGRAPRPHLTNAALEVLSGEVHVVVGAAGSGKSLILDVLVGRRRISRGATKVLGIDPTEHPREVRALLTHVPEGGQMDRALSPRRQLFWWANLVGMPTTPVAIRRALRDAELPDRFFDEPAGLIPAEFRVLTWIALANLRGHKVLLIDDPVRSGSVSATRHLSGVLQELSRRGCAVLVATRDNYFAEAVGHRLTWLEDGRTHQATGVRHSITPHSGGF